MKKKYSKQKKKTPKNTLARLLFKTLVFVAILIFAFIIYEKSDFMSDVFDFSNKKGEATVKKNPSQLEWYDDFKGIENVPSKGGDKKSSEGKRNFLQYQADQNKK